MFGLIHRFADNYGINKSFLNFLWEAWCAIDTISDEKHEIKPKSFLDILHVLYEIGLIDSQDKQQFVDFNSLRNNLAHNMFGVKRKKIKKHQIETDFEKGMICSGMMPVLFTREIHVLGKRHNEFKSKIFRKIRKKTGKI